MCECFARQRPIDFSVSSGAGGKCFGIAAREISLASPVDRGQVDVLAKPHREDSVMHEQCKQKNDRQRNADEPKQRAFSK
jgi:hypothetical protein